MSRERRLHRVAGTAAASGFPPRLLAETKTRGFVIRNQLTIFLFNDIPGFMS
jgi:hypothetical protein